MTPLIVKWGRGKTSLLPEVPKLGQHVLGTPSENRKFPQIVPQSSPDAAGYGSSRWATHKFGSLLVCNRPFWCLILVKILSHTHLWIECWSHLACPPCIKKHQARAVPTSAASRDLSKDQFDRKCLELVGKSAGNPNKLWFEPDMVSSRCSLKALNQPIDKCEKTTKDRQGACPSEQVLVQSRLAILPFMRDATAIKYVPLSIVLTRKRSFIVSKNGGTPN